MLRCVVSCASTELMGSLSGSHVVSSFCSSRFCLLMTCMPYVRVCVCVCVCVVTSIAPIPGSRTVRIRPARTTPYRGDSTRTSRCALMHMSWCWIRSLLAAPVCGVMRSLLCWCVCCVLCCADRYAAHEECNTPACRIPNLSTQHIPEGSTLAQHTTTQQCARVHIASHHVLMPCPCHAHRIECCAAAAAASVMCICRCVWCDAPPLCCVMLCSTDDGCCTVVDGEDTIAHLRRVVVGQKSGSLTHTGEGDGKHHKMQIAHQRQTPPIVVSHEATSVSVHTYRIIT